MTFFNDFPEWGNSFASYANAAINSFSQMSYTLGNLSGTVKTIKEQEPKFIERSFVLNFYNTFNSLGGKSLRGEAFIRAQRVVLDFVKNANRTDVTFYYWRVDTDSSKMVKDDYTGLYVMYDTSADRMVTLDRALVKLNRIIDPKRLRIAVSKGTIRVIPVTTTGKKVGEDFQLGMAVLGAGEERQVFDYILTDVIESINSYQINYVTNLRKHFRKNLTPVESVDKTRSGTGDLDAFLSKRRSDVHALDVTTVFDIPKHGVLSSRNWGIEIEAAGARHANRPKGWDSRYDGSLESAYSGSSGPEPEAPAEVYEPEEPEEPEYPEREDYEADDEETYQHDVDNYEEEMRKYKVALAEYEADMESYEEYEEALREYEHAYDAWENSDESDDDCKEFVSPILHSFHSQGLENLLEELNREPQNDSAGVHVHVEVGDLSIKQLGSLVYGYNLLENILESAYKRNTRGYCKAVRPQDFREMGKSSKTLSQIKGTPLVNFYSPDRYISLNLEAISAHGTVEFRAMGPRYEYDALIRWASICREFVNVARAGATHKDWNNVKDAQGLKNLFIRFGKETAENAMAAITSEDIDAMVEKNGDGWNSDRVKSEFVEVSGEI